MKKIFVKAPQSVVDAILEKEGKRQTLKWANALAIFESKLSTSSEIIEYRTNGQIVQEADGQKWFHAWANTDAPARDWRTVKFCV